MTDLTDEHQKSNINADHNSNAVGSISAGGDISGNIYIGNVYQTPEDDLPLSSDEIENGLSRFAQYLPERAPVLQDSFSSIAKKLRATLGADQNSLSPILRKQREEAFGVMKPMCMEVTDISFRAICLGQNPPPYDSRPPFLGLFAFHPEDREFFFGRDALVQKLVARIKLHPFLAVLGASGSGKSSLVMAGLVPALEAQMSYLTPSSAPLSQLLTAKESASAKTVFVIDQFEELFTHPHDAAERADFIHALLELTKTNRVVITMRADFWGEVAIYSDLKQAMQEHQELIAPMTVDELHSAMEKQAAVVGLRFDPTLSESILAEVKGEPGAMPLLQHALWELWNRRHGLWIKAEEYQAFGGVKQAIASTAEEVYASCSDFERTRVRDIFLRLTRLDESGEGRDTRRRVLIEELIPVNSDSSVTINLLNKLADARLIVKTDKDVEVAHEALIRHWSRLTEWLNEDRDNLRLREGVSESAREWDASKRDDSLLNHRGGRLEFALAMSKLSRYQLNPIEQAYLNACVSLRNKEQRERERRLRYTVIASIMAAVIFLVLGSFGLVKSNEATAQAATAQANANAASTAQANAEIEKQNAQAQAETAATAQALAETQRNAVLGRQLAAQAKNIFDKQQLEQLSTARLLAVLSMRSSPTVDAAEVLSESNYFNLDYRNPGSFMSSVAFSPDGTFMVSGGCSNQDVSSYICKEGVMRVLSSLGEYNLFNVTYDNAITAVDFSPLDFNLDGAQVVSGGGDHSVRLWNILTTTEVIRMMHDDYVTSVDFSPDGKYVVSGSGDHTARVWEVQTGREVARMLHDSVVSDVLFSPDGKYIATGSWDGTARVWNAMSGEEIVHKKHGISVSDVDFSYDGKYVVSGGCLTYNPNLFSCLLNGARVWDAKTGEEITNVKDDQVNLLFLASDSEGPLFTLLGNRDGTARLWDLRTPQKAVGIPNNGEGYVFSVAFSPDGKYVASGGWNGSARIWDVETGMDVMKMPYDGFVFSVAFSPDGKYLVSAGCEQMIVDHFTCERGLVRVWELSTGTEIVRMRHNSFVYSVVFSPDGKYIGSASADGTVRGWLWKTEDLLANGCERVTKNLTHEEWNLYIGGALPYQAVCPDLPIEAESTPVP